MRGKREDEPDLFDNLPYNGGAPYQKHSNTSRAAAAAIKRRIGPMHQKIIKYLQDNPRGATDEALGDELRIAMNTLRPRRRELQLMGRVRDSGRTGFTMSGRAAVIWILETKAASAV